MNRALLSLASSLGIGLRWQPTFAPFWDGKALDLKILDESPFHVRDGLLAHEIGHFLCAPHARRRVPNYGLGPTIRDLSDPPVLLDRHASDAEENLASLVGNVIVARHVPDALPAALEQTNFVGEGGHGESVLGWPVRRLLQRAMGLGVLGTCPLPPRLSPHVLVEFLAQQADVLLAPLLGEAA